MDNHNMYGGEPSENSGVFSGGRREPEISEGIPTENISQESIPMDNIPPENMAAQNDYIHNNQDENYENYYNNYGQQYGNQGYSCPPQGGYQQETEPPVSMGEWIVSLLLVTFVPCVNIILMFVWAFGSTEKKSKSNFFKALLIVSAIQFVLMLLVGTAIFFFWLAMGY